MPLFLFFPSYKAILKKPDEMKPCMHLPSFRLDAYKKIFQRDTAFFLASGILQVLIGLFFGHLYDMRIFMATGYLVATGQNPYAAQDLSAVFHNSFFQGITSIGYPPPWPYLLGIIYRIVYATTQNYLLYNLAIKIPIIAANLCLAYVVKSMLKKIGASDGKARQAWLFMLFNPLLFYFATAWGQIDSLVALFALLALMILKNGKIIGSSALLTLAISFKPIALPILPVVIFYLWRRSHREGFWYFCLSVLFLFLFCVAPFFVFGWDAEPIIKNWNAHFTVVGGMSLLTFFELLFNSYLLLNGWWLLGMLWVPAVGIALISVRSRIQTFMDILNKALGLVLVFFLTRAWLSEPNIILIIPLILILVVKKELNGKYLAAVTILTLVITIFNGSPPQLLFPSQPGLMSKMLSMPGEFRTAGLIARSIMVLPWQYIGWKIVAASLKSQKRIG
jgi:Gpi18-like mannosyltransferase